MSLVFSVLVAGCAVGPDYRERTLVTPDSWNTLPEQAVRAESEDASILAAWWTVFEDPLLTELIEQALANNKTVEQARARVLEARARRGAAAGPFFPSIDASAGASRTKYDERIVVPEDGLVARNDRELYTGGLDASWELDLFGRQRRAFEAATATLGATEAELRDALVTLLGDVAVNYTALRTAQARLALAERNLAAQSELVDITRWRAEAGLATVLDVEQAETSYQQTRAQIPLLESSLTNALNPLAVLTGQMPGALLEWLSAPAPIPVGTDTIVVDVPADVVRRRPDIRAAERRLAAQSAQVGVAKAALYPSLSLSGSIGLQSLSASDLLDGSQTDRVGLS